MKKEKKAVVEYVNRIISLSSSHNKHPIFDYN